MRLWVAGSLSLLLSAVASCSGTSEPEGPFADPWTVMPSSEIPPVRGYGTLRGIVHCHSPYSHDACDNEPFIDGVRNEQCFEDDRSGMCGTAQDFVFLTDHDNIFADYEYPEVLLYKAGDRLIERGGLPVANRVVCPDGREVIVAAGTETGMMPIGLEHHVGATPEERRTAYNDVSPAAVAAFRAAGALVFLQHTEGWEVETIRELQMDGIEMYNTHQNLIDNLGAALEMVLLLESDPDSLMVPELALIGLFQENEADLTRWAILSLERSLPAIVATDVHRNAFPGPSPDGERLDSFRRMMHWFSNHLRIPEGAAVDDAVLKSAIGAGRLYGAFEYLGYPVGFDYFAQVGADIHEMGERLSGGSATLTVRLPHIYRLDPESEQPVIRARLLRAEVAGTWTEVASDTADLVEAVGPGVYRAEVRIIPYHLRPWLGPNADTYLTELVWIYSNPIYVDP